MSWNAQQTVKMRPKVAPRRPRASQTPPKWSPKIFPNQFFQHFLGLFVSGRNFAFLFCRFVAECVCFLKSRPLKFMRPRSVLLTSTRSGIFRKKYQKSSKNSPETLPKSNKNQGKIKKNEKIDGKSQDERGKPKNVLKIRKNCEK